MSDWHDNLRVHYDSRSSVTTDTITDIAPVRTAPQAHTDHALNEATKAATESLHLAEDAVAWLASVNGGHVKNQEVPRGLTKLIEEIDEVRRMRR